MHGDEYRCDNFVSFTQAHSALIGMITSSGYCHGRPWLPRPYRGAGRLERSRAEVRRERADRHEARITARSLEAKLKVKEDVPKDVATLQQQLTAAKTRNLNLSRKVRAALHARDEARKDNPVRISKANPRKLQKVFYPDTEHSTATRHA